VELGNPAMVKPGNNESKYETDGQHRHPHDDISDGHDKSMRLLFSSHAHARSILN
jgi:hypothetical protein